MNIPAQFEKQFAAFPIELRSLVEAELAAGNEIAEFGHGHPAPFGGAYIKLTRAVTTRPRMKQAPLDFYERNISSHSGEFTDAQRHYFVLEPPVPPPLPPDMDAIRAAMEARERAANASRDLFY